VTLIGDLDGLVLNTDFEVTAASYTGDAFAGSARRPALPWL
jgi:hypothetical protein